MDAREQWAKVRELDGDVSLTLGPNTSNRYLGDPKRLSFMLARYSFAAKMLVNCGRIYDWGCGDGFGTATFLTDTKARFVVGIDFDETLIDYANMILRPALTGAERIRFLSKDILGFEGWWSAIDGIACIDCIEHIDPEKSLRFLQTMNDSLARYGIAVIGTPNEHAAHLGSAHSKLGHINNYTPERLRSDLLAAGFSNVFMFGMNDCTINMGHPSLWHYIFAVGVK